MNQFFHKRRESSKVRTKNVFHLICWIHIKRPIVFIWIHKCCIFEQLSIKLLNLRKWGLEWVWIQTILRSILKKFGLISRYFWSEVFFDRPLSRKKQQREPTLKTKKLLQIGWIEHERVGWKLIDEKVFYLFSEWSSGRISLLSKPEIQVTDSRNWMSLSNGRQQVLY